jgi:hypothetical protein
MYTTTETKQKIFSKKIAKILNTTDYPELAL